MVFIFKVQTWNFVCGIRMSFAFTMENILSVWYTATPGWTSKFGKVWKTRCQNAATRTKIWRCFLVSWDDKYSWVMVSNNRHELHFCSKLLCFSSIHCFFSCDQAALWMVASFLTHICVTRPQWVNLLHFTKSVYTLLFKSNGIFFGGGKIWCLFLRYRLEILCVA